ncbi:MAG: zinc-binding dehydrogenase [Burkholderiaceae bacterium]|nr:zinc-binding dehydrogenase [Burkholderiaceae bacterium]
MHAVRYHRFGGLDELRYEEVPTPSPAPGEVLVRVGACGVNRVDILSREGQTPYKTPFPHISGSDVAGIVADLGEGVEGIELGCRVAVLPNLSCGECPMCRAGEDNMCVRGGIFGIMCHGGYAEYTLAPARNIVPLPESMGSVDAAAMAIVGGTAWHMLVTRACLRQAEDLLVVAAGSGIGSMAVQIGKLSGARVIATAGSSEKLEKIKALGADFTVDHSRPGWSAEVRRITQRRGVDVVFEHVGEATWEQSLACLTRNGRLVTCGGHTGFNVGIDLWQLFVKQITLIGSFAATRQDLLDVLTMASRGQLRPVLHSVLPLAEAAEAQRLMENRGIFGKIVLTP